MSGEAAGKIEQEDYARTTCPPLHIGLFWAPPRREKKGVLSAWETERSTRTHRAGTLLVQARSRVLSPPPPQFSRAGALLLSISWPLSPPPPLSRFHASSFLLLSQCHPSYVGGGAAAILDSLKMETGKKKKILLAFSSSVSSAEFVQMSVFYFLQGLNAVREQNKA